MNDELIGGYYVDEQSIRRNVVLSFHEGERGRKISRLDDGKVVIVDKTGKDNVIIGVDYICDVLNRTSDRYAIAYPKELMASSKLILTEDGRFVLVYVSNGNNITLELKSKDLVKVLHEKIGKGRNIPVSFIIR